MLFHHKMTLAVAGTAFLLAGGRASLASITVHDLSENTATGVYTYSIQLDAAANVQSGDGFVIYDFPGLVSYSITGGFSNSQFSLSQSLTSNAITKPTSVDSISDANAVANGLTFDSPTVENLSFAYNGPPAPFLGATLATLTITTSVLGADTTSVYGSVDHSGSSPAFPFSFSTNPVFVPVATPEPATLALVMLSGLPLILRRRKRLA